MLQGADGMGNRDRALAGRSAIAQCEVRQERRPMVRETRMNAPAVIGLRLVVRNEGRAKRRDFYDRYDLLLANCYLLTNRIQQEIEEVRYDLHDELAYWPPHQPEPHSHHYAAHV